MLAASRALELPPDSAVLLENGEQVLLTAALFGPRAPELPQDGRWAGGDTATRMEPFVAASPMLCDGAGPGRASESGRAAVLALRGNCSFAAKAAEAARRGYDAVVVVNSVFGILSSGTPNFTAATPFDQLSAQPCDVDCAAGSAWAGAGSVTTAQVLDGSACAAAGVTGCGQGPCVPSGLGRTSASEGPQRQVCCVSDHATRMQGDVGGLKAAEAFFATMEGGKALAATAPATVGLGTRWVPSVDPSAFVSWAVGFGALVAASWYGAEEERLALRPRGDGRPARPATPAPLETVPLTVREVALMLLGAAVVLSGLFLLIQLGVQIVFLVIAMFCVAGTSAVGVLVFYPCTHRSRAMRAARCDVPWCGEVTGAGAAAAVLAATVMAAWFALRHQPWSWLPQDAVGLLLCCLFCRQVRVPSLRLAVAICGVFLVYDVIMVFLTPLLVGSSVMIDVATAGAPVAVVDRACYCRENPGDWSVCGPGERMPILFAVPRIQDYRGGFALLGLGDVVIPGMVVTLGLRMDLVGSGSARGGYWLAALASYAAGLAAANVAVVATGVGQPALLYIMPFVAGGLALMAWRKGQLGRAWVLGADTGVQAARRGAGGGGGGGGPGAGDADDGAFARLRGSGVLGGGSDEDGDAPGAGGATPRGAFGGRLVGDDDEDDDPEAGDLGGGAGQHWGSVVPARASAVEVELGPAGDVSASLGKGDARGGTA